MTTTDREDLYQQAYEQYRNRENSIEHGIRAVVDLALDARPDRQPWEVLREADKLIRGHWNFDGIDSTRLIALAKDLEAEHRAAQEKAEREAAREKLIEQAAQVLHRAGSFGQKREWSELGEEDREFFMIKARALADAGLLSAPTTDGGEA